MRCASKMSAILYLMPGDACGPAQEHDMELEGACEGTLACSTCHCIFTPEMFDKLPPADEVCNCAHGLSFGHLPPPPSLPFTLAHKLTHAPPRTQEELDMLDLAAGLTDTSRLGCQVVSHLSPLKWKRQPARQLMIILILLMSPNAQSVVAS